MSEKERDYLTLSGARANKSNIVGYCRLHKVHLTATQVKQKECLSKGCHALKKWEHKFWSHRERIKEVKQLKKEQGIPAYQKVEIRTDSKGNLLTKLRKKK